MGVATGDVDNDGWVDLYLKKFDAPNQLLRNNGDGTFTDISKASGTDHHSWSVSATFVDIDRDSGQIFIDIGGRLIPYRHEDLDQLVHAYAISIHKSQGSEYPAVVIPLLTQHYMMLERNLLYTAITRGRKLVVLVGSKRAVSMAVERVSAKTRWTHLADRIQSGLR